MLRKLWGLRWGWRRAQLWAAWSPRPFPGRWGSSSGTSGCTSAARPAFCLASEALCWPILSSGVPGFRREHRVSESCTHRHLAEQPPRAQPGPAWRAGGGEGLPSSRSGDLGWLWVLECPQGVRAGSEACWSSDTRRGPASALVILLWPAAWGPRRPAPKDGLVRWPVWGRWEKTRW